MPKRTKKQRKELSSAALWYEEHLRGKLSLMSVAVVIGALAIAYFVGVLPEYTAGLALAGLVILVTCGYAGMALLQASRNNLEGGLGLGLALISAVASVGPVISTLVPGRPVAQGVLAAPGESLPLPGQARHIRVLLHADFGNLTASSVDVVLDAGAGSITGHLERSISQARIGRRGRGTMVEEHNSVFVDGDVGGRHALTLGDMRGNVAGGVQVNVFKQWLPFRVECAIAALLLVLAAVVAGRFGLGAPPAAAVGAALLFGIMVYVMATPDSAVKSEVGALMVAGLGGTVGGGTLGWLGRKLLGRRRAARA